MYYSTFAHLDRQFDLPTHDVTAPKRSRASRRGSRARLPVLALRPVAPHSACGESR